MLAIELTVRPFFQQISFIEELRHMLDLAQVCSSLYQPILSQIFFGIVQSYFIVHILAYSPSHASDYRTVPAAVTDPCVRAYPRNALHFLRGRAETAALRHERGAWARMVLHHPPLPAQWSLWRVRGPPFETFAVLHQAIVFSGRQGVVFR